LKKSNLSLEELKQKNAYSAGQIYSNYSRITFKVWTNSYQKHKVNG